MAHAVIRTKDGDHADISGLLKRYEFSPLPNKGDILHFHDDHIEKNAVIVSAWKVIDIKHDHITTRNVRNVLSQRQEITLLVEKLPLDAEHGEGLEGSG